MCARVVLVIFRGGHSDAVIMALIMRNPGPRHSVLVRVMELVFLYCLLVLSISLS